MIGYSVFLRRYDGVIDHSASAKFSKGIGCPVNVSQRADGTLIDINVGGMQDRPLPTPEQLRNSIETNLGDPDVKEIHRIRT